MSTDNKEPSNRIPFESVHPLPKTGMLPCPYCGDPNVTGDIVCEDGSWVVEVDCCGARGPLNSATPAEAIEKWNRRRTAAAWRRLAAEEVRAAARKEVRS